jgi:hypothetical protein
VPNLRAVALAPQVSRCRGGLYRDQVANLYRHREKTCHPVDSPHLVWPRHTPQPQRAGTCNHTKALATFSC